MNLHVWLKTVFTKWRLLLLAFVVVYAFFLTLNLGYMSIQWDEIPHLYGGLLLTRGQFEGYVSTYGYYPPVYDLLATGFFHLFGVSAASGRLVAVMFSLLSIWVVFEFANRTYCPKVALLASIMLGVMPGFFWVSRMAMLETVLMFFFSLALLFFFSWLHFSENKLLILCGLTIGVGFLAKYQILVAGLVMIVAILVLNRKRLRFRLSKFLVLPLIAVIVVVPWVMVIYQINGLNRFGELLYVIQEGGQDRAIYSSRFPWPIFYLIEMTWPFNDIPVHPISLPLYVVGLCGLGLWAYKRRTEDKFFLLWFLVVYLFFTLIPNKQWRYVTPLFPVLAISTASFLFFVYGKIRPLVTTRQLSLRNRRVRQVAAAVFIALAASAVIYSSYNAYEMTVRDQIHIPIEEATSYVASRISGNESMLVLFAWNLFNQDMVRFYLPAEQAQQNPVLQYPELPVDSFAYTLNVNELISLCQEKNVKYLFLYEHEDIMDVYTKLQNSGRFEYEAVVGETPRSISILVFK
ncbi:MAG: glycosyltransferase family 39 protein [Candidatus Bathyarchaeota archaeon]|nr:glycosyltransferase family 39 protein [Candidatus Bathyarchaeota archaeon]